MPKTLTPAIRAHLDGETTRLAAIWRIRRTDGQQFFFTDHDRDIVFGGDTYRADAGFERTAIQSDAGFAVDNLDLVGVFAEGGIVEDDVRAGLFDGAAISFVNWQDPDTYGEIKLRRGTLGEVRLTPQGHFTAEPRGLSQPLAQSTLQSTARPVAPISARTGAGSRSSRRCSSASRPCSSARSTGRHGGRRGLLGLRGSHL